MYILYIIIVKKLRKLCLIIHLSTKINLGNNYSVLHLTFLTMKFWGLGNIMNEFGKFDAVFV